MAANIKDFPQFHQAIRTHELVYLFGTGISASLTGKDYSWWKWILEGISYMKDRELAEQCRSALEADCSADQMIRVAGTVLAAAKADGAYPSWMQASFETNPVTNVALAETLKKLLRTQDVFATTNYDLLLEQATGLGTLSYEDPDKAFPMLDQKISTHVLHIHGVYDSAHGVDNIVADRDQYDAVLGDEGAQFIQHILGTRTLVFIGCGKTTEDANVAQFIRFAGTHLKMDREYYFLYKEGQDFAGMPDNIRLIPYGDSYDDLPVFLESIAQERLGAFAQKSAMVGRMPFRTGRAMADPLMKYHYSQEQIPFRGRTAERRALQEFVACTDQFSWWAVTGQAGAGKSRLAWQLLKELPAGWFGFFLDDKVSPGDADAFAPFSHVLAVIDYVSGREWVVAEIMRRLKQRFETSAYSLRILLLERENSRITGSWYARLRQRFGKYDNLREAEYGEEFLDLGDLEDTDVAALIGEVCEADGLPADSGRDEMLREAYRQKFETLRFRPLYVQMFVEAWIANGFSLPRYDSFEALLRRLLEREQERWLTLLDGDQACCSAWIHLLLRANITGELDTNQLPDYYRPDWEIVCRFLADHAFPGQQQRELARAVIQSVCQKVEDGSAVIAPLFPDVIKEYMFCFYMEENRLPAVMREIWQNAAHGFSVFMTRCLTDFPDAEFFRYALNVYEKGASDREVLMGRMEMLKKRVIRDNDDPVVLMEIIDNEYAFWKDITVPQEPAEEADMLAVLKITGLNLVARQYGGWSMYDVSQMVSVIEEALAVSGGQAAEIMKQFYLQDHINQLSQAGFTEEAAYLGKKMDSLIGENPESEWNSYLDMLNQNAEMMNRILADDFAGGVCVFEKMAEKCNYRNVEAVRILAHSCFNIDHFAFLLKEEKHGGIGLSVAETAALLFPQDPVIRVRLLGCRVIRLQRRYFAKERITDGMLLEELDQIDRDLDDVPFGDRQINEALDMTWGVSRGLRLNVIRENEKELTKVIGEARSILAQYPELTDILAVCIAAVHMLHRYARKDRVPHEEVEELFRYVELNGQSESVREAFFDMLEDSEDAHRRQDYITKRVAVGARQDARYNLYGSGLEEFDEEEEFFRRLYAYEPQEPYRREKPKIGRNDPCPCGSGKKFKKCCLGKRIYD